jgi:hypothetical protein
MSRSATLPTKYLVTNIRIAQQKAEDPSGLGPPAGWQDAKWRS